MQHGGKACQTGGMGRVFPIRRVTWLWLLGAIALYGCLALVLPQFVGFRYPFARTFNSMLAHLLQGRFDVDPAIVGPEGFAREGRVYAYWGVMPAILRLPVTILPGWRGLDFTIGYCVIALLLMGSVKVWTARLVFRHNPAVPRPLAKAIVVVIVLSGAQTCFVRLSPYQEVCFWAGLWGALFVAAAISAQHRGTGTVERLVMAAAAGAALLTRVSTGIGLIAAFGALLLVEAIGNRADWRGELRRWALPIAVLLAAGLATAWVNQARWGNPLTFADYQYYIYNQEFPERLARTADYGLFNLARVPFGLIYYFVPVWVLKGGDGKLLFDATRQRLIDSAELPSSSFLLTDALLMVLAGVAVVAWLTRRPGGRQGRAIALGLSVPPLLMLSAISMCFRYRMDFYPLIEFLAFSGLGMVGGSGLLARPRLVWALAGISVVTSIAAGIAYVAGELGPAQLLIGNGVGDYYLGRLGLR